AKDGMPRWALGQLFVYYENLALIVAGVAIFLLLFSVNISRHILLSFAPAGSLTLTFYVVHSLVFVPVFYGFGLACYSYLGQVLSWSSCFVCWLVLMGIVWVWLRHFRYLPFEGLWRKLLFLGFRPAQK